MYYLYKKSKSVMLPEFKYDFGRFADFYEISHLLDVPLLGIYNIRVKCDDYKELIQFLNDSDKYGVNLVIYVELSETLLKYIQLQKPNVSILSSKSNFELFKELISKHKILFDKKCISSLYFSIEHDRDSMDEALTLISNTYPSGTTITLKMLTELFAINNVVWPRQVTVSFLRMERWRWSKFNKSLEYFGNDMLLYSMRKNVAKMLDAKIKYLKTGEGDYVSKTIPYKNIVLLYSALCLNRMRFMDIRTILYLYEKGETVNDFVQRTSG